MINSNQLPEKPVIGILHNLARSGGTLVSRCIGSMCGVRLLSEIHPQGLQYFDPIKQAANWFGLIEQNDIQALITRQGKISFSDAIALIYSKCIEEGSCLVIRDWAYVDFIGMPFNPSPSGHHVLTRELGAEFRLNEVSLVRHPVDQWLSLTKDPKIAKVLTLKRYLKGYLRYAQCCQDHVFIRYEDFTRSPQNGMRQICDNLGIEYDRDFLNKWSSYLHITGDPGTRDRDTITEVRRYSVPKKLSKQLRNNQEYEEVLHLLGFEDIAI